MEKKYNASFSMVNEKEFALIVNAIKRQVDYYKNRVINSRSTINEYALIQCKNNLKMYNDLYDKIIQDYQGKVKIHLLESES